MGPRYPDVPDTPGVPPVYRDDTNPITAPSTPALTDDDAQAQASSRPAWAIVTADGNFVDFDSLVALEPSRDFRISDYPVEAGGFQSYDKVALPAETRVTVTKEGGDSDRQAFFDQLDAMVETTDLFNVVTPDSSFLDRNLTRYGYDRRADRGRGLITVELFFQEVRQSARSAFTNSKQANGDDPVNDGPVQPATPSGSQVPSSPPV